MARSLEKAEDRRGDGRKEEGMPVADGSTNALADGPTAKKESGASGSTVGGRQENKGAVWTGVRWTKLFAMTVKELLTADGRCCRKQMNAIIH